MKNRCFADPSISKFGNQPIESSDAENVDLLRESKNAIAAIARVANIVPAGANVAIGVANQKPCFKAGYSSSHNSLHLGTPKRKGG